MAIAEGKHIQHLDLEMLEKGEGRGRSEREESSSIGSFPMATMAPGWTKLNPWHSSKFRVRVVGIQHWNSLPLSSHIQWQGAGLETEQLALEPLVIGNAGVADPGWIHYIAMLAPICNIYSVFCYLFLPLRTLSKCIWSVFVYQHGFTLLQLHGCQFPKLDQPIKILNTVRLPSWSPRPLREPYLPLFVFTSLLSPLHSSLHWKHEQREI